MLFYLTATQVPNNTIFKDLGFIFDDDGWCVDEPNIEISTLEQLTAFAEEHGGSLVLNVGPNVREIEIYNDWRE